MDKKDELLKTSLEGRLFTLSKIDRMMTDGFKARDREIQRAVQPLQQDINEFLIDLGVRYNAVLIGEHPTHKLDWDRNELVPIVADLSTAD
jgi:hypothetical protein